MCIRDRHIAVIRFNGVDGGSHDAVKGTDIKGVPVAPVQDPLDPVSYTHLDAYLLKILNRLKGLILDGIRYDNVSAVYAVQGHIDNCAPVSYTHLDVYKRQVSCPPVSITRYLVNPAISLILLSR